jgi:hypothetical protein
MSDNDDASSLGGPTDVLAIWLSKEIDVVDLAGASSWNGAWQWSGHFYRIVLFHTKGDRWFCGHEVQFEGFLPPTGSPYHVAFWEIRVTKVLSECARHKISTSPELIAAYKSSRARSNEPGAQQPQGSSSGDGNSPPDPGARARSQLVLDHGIHGAGADADDLPSDDAAGAQETAGEKDRRDASMPAVSPSESAATGYRLKEPSRLAFDAYALHVEAGWRQTAVANQLSEVLGRRITQGQVSRWVQEVRKWRGEGNVSPRPTNRPIPMDPRKIDLRSRTQ